MSYHAILITIYKNIFVRRDKLEIIRIFNNNAVLVDDLEGGEAVALGKGLGFNQKVGNTIDDERVEKLFKESHDNRSFQELFVELSTGEVDSILAIIDLATKKTGQHYQGNLYVTLADHIHFALERTEKGMDLANPLAWNVKRLFVNEYQVGLQALTIIEHYTGVRLPDNEAASIALHLVNAGMNNGEMDQTIKVVKIERSILALVRMHFGVTFDEESIAYNRFVTHLQYFALRIINGEASNGSGQFLYSQVKENYPEAMHCAVKIQQHIQHQYAYLVNEEEMSYLAIHINRLLES